MLAHMSSIEGEAEHRDREKVVNRPPPAPLTAEGTFDTPESPVERMASAIGNRNMGSVMARFADGQGLMPDGTVHPDVTAAIDAMSGKGRRLDRQTLETLRPTHGDVSDAVIHTGPEAEQLARAVSAKAFTVGRDVFFGPGASPADLDLTRHELAHVVQSRNAPRSGPLKATFPGDAVERGADEIARG
jgi:hypothetical protein